MSNAIVTSDLSKHYGNIIGVENINLNISRGDVCGFLGPNGAGKTTFIRLLLGLITPTSGHFTLLDADEGADRRMLLNRIGYLPGDLGLYTHLTGDSYLEHLLTLQKGASSLEGKAKLHSLKSLFNIDFHRKISTYSKGMRQVIGIIQAFMHKPDLLILDEPTSGLDPGMQEIFYELMCEEKERGTTVFFSSHLLNEVERVSDNVALIKEGKLQAVSSVHEFCSGFGYKVNIRFSEDNTNITESFSRFEEVTDLKVEGNTCRMHYTGDINSLIRHLAAQKVDDFLCEPPSLEDVFMRFYED